MLAASAVMCSCEKDHTYEDNTDPEIALYQITGTWKLESWICGQIPEGVYSYIVLDSKEDKGQNIISGSESRHLRLSSL